MPARSSAKERAPSDAATTWWLAPFDPVLARAMVKDPRKRYASADDFAVALDAALTTATEPEPTVVGGSISETLGPDGGSTLEVLIVDDDPVFRRLAARCAQVAWYRHRIRIRMVDSGAAAVAAARETMPALIVLDYRMPGMSGVEALTMVRDLPRGTSARVIVASASLGDVARWSFGLLGVSDFLEKPIDMPAFVALLGELAADARWSTSVATTPW